MLPTKDAAPITIRLLSDCGYGMAGQTIELPARSAFKVLRRGEGEAVVKAEIEQAEKRAPKKAQKKAPKKKTKDK